MMRAALFVLVIVTLTACFGTIPPETGEPNVEDTIADAISEISGQEAVEPEEPKLLAFLRPPRKETPETDADITIVTADTESRLQTDNPRGLAALFSPRVPMKSEIDQNPQAESEGANQASGSLFGFLRPKSTASGKSLVSESPAKVELATLTDEASQSGPNRGFFGRLAAGSSKSKPASGHVLPFGSVGVACGISKRELGKQVDKFPDSAMPKWRLYDTQPTATGPRTQYITGFSDGCARHFTAALAMFGTPALHETHRYGAAQKNVPYSAPDLAYEKIKASVCGVDRGQPCPDSRSKTMERNASFVTVYQRFGGSASWMEMLLHNGKLVASETHAK